MTGVGVSILGFLGGMLFVWMHLVPAKGYDSLRSQLRSRPRPWFEWAIRLTLLASMFIAICPRYGSERPFIYFALAGMGTGFVTRGLCAEWRLIR